MAAVFKNTIRLLLGIVVIGFISFHLPNVISSIFEKGHIFIRLPMTVILLLICLYAASSHKDNISIRTHCAALLTSLITLITIYYTFGDLMPYLIKNTSSYIHLTWGEIKRHPDFIPFITHIIFIFIVIVFVSFIIALSAILSASGFLISGNITAFIFCGTNRFFFPVPKKNKGLSQSKPLPSSENKSKSKIIREIKRTIRQKY